MTISYNWLSEYLPEAIEPQNLSKILTSVGLEVESLEKYESIKGALKGLVIGEVLEVGQHPNADKLKLTKVNIGSSAPLQIVCGASNVAVGQKVVVAPVGASIYPTNGTTVTMKLATIRGIESEGMICAEDEIGLGTNHDGIMVLPEDAKAGSAASSHFTTYEDWIFEIGLTPNRMDAMSHIGVAKDVCAYLSYHNKKDLKPVTPYKNNFKADNQSLAFKVSIANTKDCQRYAGVTISNIVVADSPEWLKQKLMAIGQRPINNIVDITNYILHETGQPLHAFDAASITGNEIIVQSIPEASPFITLDEKERKISEEDLMICNSVEPMCIAGVFGGATSGVNTSTTSIFLESAWFNPTSIRKTSFRHQLRTEAATRFEKGVDISNVVTVLKRAALLIKEVAGGSITSDIVDIYPNPIAKTEVGIKYHYLKKLSGKNYHPDAVSKILVSLGFDILKEGMDELRVAVPFSKHDITLPADIVEEILRIDGLDNVEIPTAIRITPSVDENGLKETLREKIANFLVGLGFNEIVTNSITNSKYFTEQQLSSSVKMINNLSVDLDVMRPSMLQTGLETIAYNNNRKNTDLTFFEFGKTYNTKGVGNYIEDEHLSLFLTGSATSASWKQKPVMVDLYKAKGVAEAVTKLCGITMPPFQTGQDEYSNILLTSSINNQVFVSVSEVSTKQLQTFGIKQPVFFVDFKWKTLIDFVKANTINYQEVSKFPMVQRDLSLVLDKKINYAQVENVVASLKLSKLKVVHLFDLFESEKLGADKKAFAISFTFSDDDKTLTDKEIDAMIEQLVQSFKTALSAEIRK